MISDQNCMTIFEHLQRTEMEPPVLFRLEQESLPQVLELCWLLHKQRLILRRLVFHKLVFHRLELHKLAHSTLVRMDHTLASGSSALEASTLAASALAVKALEAYTSGYHSKCCTCFQPG